MPSDNEFTRILQWPGYRVYRQKIDEKNKILELWVRRKRGNRATTQGEWTLAEPTDDDAPEAIAIRDNLRDAVRAVMGQLRPQDLEVIVAATYEGQRPSLAATAFRKRLQRALANSRVIWKKYYGDDRTG